MCIRACSSLPRWATSSTRRSTRIWLGEELTAARQDVSACPRCWVICRRERGCAASRIPHWVGRKQPAAFHRRARSNMTPFALTTPYWTDPLDRRRRHRYLRARTHSVSHRRTSHRRRRRDRRPAGAAARRWLPLRLDEKSFRLFPLLCGTRPVGAAACPLGSAIHRRTAREPPRSR